MMKKNLHFLGLSVAAVVLGLIAPLYADIVQTFAISKDTYIDSQNPTKNYGVATTAKVVVNGNDGSLTHAMFTLPDSIWSIPQSQIVSAKVWFYVFSDNTGSRTVNLYPLTAAFAEGSGNGTVSGDGATWQTSDGTNSWITPGGDYDLSTFVTASKSTNWFSWDITGLLNNTDLRSFGALLRMNDESNPGAGNMPRAPFTSSNGAVGQQPYVQVTYTPDPCSLVILGFLTIVGIGKRPR
jgi:hypothetical protein